MTDTKVLFFDTSALLKMFVKEEGTPNVKWLTSPDTKVCNGLIFVVNEQVCIEFEQKISHFATKKITAQKADQIIHAFANHYKGKYFHIIGQRIISNTKKETCINEINQELNLKEGKNDWDGLIYQSLINALAFLGGASHPILVTCDIKFGKKVSKNGYRVINPMTQSRDEIRAVLG